MKENTPHTLSNRHPFPLVVRTASDAQLFCRKEAARYLGIAAQTLSQWAYTGRHALPRYKIGSKVMYKKAELDDFILRSKAVNNAKEMSHGK